MKLLGKMGALGVAPALVVLFAFCSSNRTQSSMITDTLKRIAAQTQATDSVVKSDAKTQTAKKDSSSVPKPDPGEGRVPAQDFTLTDISGATHTLSDYKGKVVLVDFWATWCPPCRQEIPHIVKLYNTYKSLDLVVLGVGLDKRSSISQFVSANSVSYTVLVDEGNVTGRLYKITGIPRTIILDKKGRIVQDHTGFAPGMENEMEEEIKALLSEEY